MTRHATINDELLAAREAVQRAREERRRLERPIAIADDLQRALEELNLAEREMVPSRLAPRLAALAVALPPEITGTFAPLLRHGVPVGTLMDVLFDVQEELIARKAGRPVQHDPKARPREPWRERELG